MRFVVTLIADPARGPIEPGLVDAAAARLEAAGATSGQPDWLCPGVACDLPFVAPDVVAGAAVLEELLRDQPVDLAVQPAQGRRKSLLVADMESTIIGQEMLDEIAEVAGLRAEIAPLTARAMAGELDFAAALSARVRLLAGLSAGVLEAVSARITLCPGARALVRTLRAEGAYTALVSGGFSLFAEPLRQACGFHEARANELIVENGRLTGGIRKPLLDGAAKLDCLVDLARARGLDLSACCAVGDGANDVAMLRAAGLGVAYHGKPPARAAAGVRIDSGDLTALLYVQGYRDNEILR